MQQTTGIPQGIIWSTFITLEDLDFADDLALLSHTHQRIQEKTNRLQHYSEQIGLKINTKKTEITVLSSTNTNHVQLNGDNIKKSDTFTYLGSTGKTDRKAETDIKKDWPKPELTLIS